MRTFLKYYGMRSKSVWLVVTNRGNYDKNDEKKIIRFMEDLGMTVRGCSSICTTDKNRTQLQADARSLAEEIRFALTEGINTPLRKKKNQKGRETGGAIAPPAEIKQ